MTLLHRRSLFKEEEEYIPVSAVMKDVDIIKNDDGTINARFLGQVAWDASVKPIAVGMIFRGIATTDLNEFVIDKENLVPHKKARVEYVSNIYREFYMTFRNIPISKSLSALVLAKVMVGDRERYVYSNIRTVTNN